jgi:hypothetical protein
MGKPPETAAQRRKRIERIESDIEKHLREEGRTFRERFGITRKQALHEANGGGGKAN